MYDYKQNNYFKMFHLNMNLIVDLRTRLSLSIKSYQRKGKNVFCILIRYVIVLLSCICCDLNIPQTRTGPLKLSF